MEALGTVASIAGILSLAVQGIQAISTLRRLYSDCTDEVAQEFLHELSVSAHLLHDVQDLCMRLKKYSSGEGRQIRLASLQVQLEDCVLDLEQWLNTAKRIDERHGKLDKKQRKLEVTTSAPKRQFATLLQAVFRASTMIATAQARTKARERFQRHQQNVHTALAILQTEIHVIQAQDLDDMKRHLENFADHSNKEQEKQQQALSNLQNSGSSVLAWSMSHDGRLRNVQSLCSHLSDKVESLICALSSQGSQISVSPGPGEVPGMRTLTSSGKCSNDTAEQMGSIVDDLSVSEPSGQAESGAEERPEGSVEDFDGEGDLSALFSMYEDFNLIVRQYFDTIVAEYIMAAQEWQTINARGRLLQLVENDQRASEMVFNWSLSTDASKCAVDLLSLRRKASMECLDESLMEADMLLGIGQHHVTQWETISKQKSEWKDTLALPNETESSIRARDLLTCTNEWLLKEMYATPHLAEVHKSILEVNLPRSKNKSSYTLREKWQRQVIKYWFLDGAASTNTGEYAASALGLDSEITVTAFNGNEDAGPDLIDNVQSDEKPAFRQIAFPPLPRGRLEELEKFLELDQPPEGIPAANKTRALKALEDYSREPAKLLVLGGFLEPSSQNYEQSISCLYTGCDSLEKTTQ